jgi:glyoxylase-like metal-dependent hydrolase (beta-lactamase superfamily II)/rhodanese-related sulfurtransferase
MEIRQFEDKGLSHFSYAVLSNCASEVVVIDPSRDITPYVEFARQANAKIIGVIETHPHADFVSGHLELYHATGAAIYASKLQKVSYPHETFDEGDVLEFGKVKLKALNTPGHSPDSISIVLEHEGKDKAVFTGDTLFIGDCGRPDLREGTADVTATRGELAKAMYYSLREKLAPLNDEVVVYPAHGAGSLCGKALRKATESTIGQERATNWSMQEMSEVEFVNSLLADQPFTPRYFGYDVSLNRKGASKMADSISEITIQERPAVIKEGIVVIDTRTEEEYKKGHIPGSINLQDGGKFETWLGSIVSPGEPFYLAGSSKQTLRDVIRKTAKIGYEAFIQGAFIAASGTGEKPTLDLASFKANPEAFTIVDVRNTAEVKQQPIFKNAISIPLPELRERVNEIPLEKPIVVHCAAGYRSAAGSSIISGATGNSVKVYDLSEEIKNFQ